IVPAGEGSRDGVSKWASSDGRAEWSVNDRERVKRGLPPVDEWRRRHEPCATTPAIVAQVIDVHGLSPYVAGSALGALREPLLARDRAASPTAAFLAAQDAAPRPWAWVGDAEREALRRAVDRARATVEPRRCKSGACAWCGVATSIGWRSSPEKWSDRTPAPLCRACAVVWDRRSQPLDRDGLRAAALEALSGANGMGSDGLGIRAYADVAGEDHNGTATPWAYAPDALAEVAERARMTWPGSLASGLRDEYLEKVSAAKREAWAALAAERTAAEQARLQAEAHAAREAGWPV
uniref:hypothetical protein n=1 Tax=Microbacterium sp. TaxID=51671 RepID=UPI0025FB1626